MFEPFLVNTPRYYDDRGYTADLTSTNSSILDYKTFCPRQTLISFSKKWVIRGMHSQIEVPQKKLISILNGTILDVVININIKSKDYGKIQYFQLDSKVNQSLFVPEGYLHGYQVLSDDSTLCYQIDGAFEPQDSITVNPLDPYLKIEWANFSEITMSIRDQEGLHFECLKKLLP